MVRLGLCCIFKEEPIKFRTTTVTHILSLNKKQALLKLSDICCHNAVSLQKAINYCANNNIGCLRISSQILPINTHPEAGYDLKNLPDGQCIIKEFKKCKSLAKGLNVRLVFHPDQFVLLSSPNKDITAKSVADLKYHSKVSDWVGADVINIHGGGAYGNKKEALDRFCRNLNKLPKTVRARITVENDDKIYTPKDLLPICKKEGIPLVYDVHHHRCLPDNMTIDQATKKALKTWNREPVFHISSPKEGWQGPKPLRHHDFIDIKDWPRLWDKLDITVEIEAKAKEIAIKRLQKELCLD